MIPEYYYYGLAATAYITTCWTFAAVRWWHTCHTSKERQQYVWPDRKLQCLLYLCATVLLPYIIDPNDPEAWMLEKCYFPACYYFYCGLLLLCFFGTVKQWRKWKTASWIAAIIVLATMLVPIVNAWLPFQFISAEGMDFWQTVVTIESLVMIGYAILAMRQVGQWIHEARDANYSNPDDFPTEYAHRVWLAPLLFTPLLWPAYIFDSPRLMAIQNVLLAVSNIVLLLNVMPAWRRYTILSGNSSPDVDDMTDTQARNVKTRQIKQTAQEIRTYIEQQQAYLNSHLRIDDVVTHTHNGRTYVSLAFSRHFGSFANYVNSLRLAHYESYVADHPDETKESAARVSGFSSYNAYYRAKQKLEREKYDYKKFHSTFTSSASSSLEVRGERNVSPRI